MHIFPDIIRILKSICRLSAILNFIKLNFFMAYPSLKPYILFYSNGLATVSGTVYQILKSIMAASRNFCIFWGWTCSGHVPTWSRTFFYSNVLTISHCFPDITHINVNFDLEFDQVEFFRGISLKQRILFHGNGLAISLGYLDIKKKKICHFSRRDLVFGRCALIFELIWAIGVINIIMVYILGRYILVLWS